MFRDILLTVDFDRTLTAPDSTIPQRNIEAIEYFMANGGKFTVNTGRSVATFWKYLDTLPANAPFLLYNGSAAYDKGQLTLLRPLDLDPWQTMQEMVEAFGDQNLEIQGTEVHYLVNQRPEMVELYENMGWLHREAVFGEDIGPFLKFSLFGRVHYPAVSDMFSGTEEELRRFDEAEDTLCAVHLDDEQAFKGLDVIYC